jgi:ABC-type multidrug transport system fused ATPase/permease subunit
MEDLKRLLKYVRPHWPAFVFAIISMLLVAVFETAIGVLLVPIFDQFIPSSGSSSSLIATLQQLIPREPWYEAWITIASLLILFTALKGDR